MAASLGSRFASRKALEMLQGKPKHALFQSSPHLRLIRVHMLTSFFFFSFLLTVADLVSSELPAASGRSGR